MYKATEKISARLKWMRPKKQWAYSEHLAGAWTAALDWAKKMKTGKLTKTEVWVSSTIWYTLSYPLPSINPSKHRWESIMSIVLNYTLPATGICHNFLQDNIFSPDHFLGMGIKHIHML